MSDTDQVLESVADAEPNEPVVTEAPEEVAVSEAVEEPEEVSEEPEVVAEPEVTEEPEPEVVAEEPEEVAASESVEEPAPEAPAPVRPGPRTRFPTSGWSGRGPPSRSQRHGLRPEARESRARCRATAGNRPDPGPPEPGRPEPGRTGEGQQGHERGAWEQGWTRQRIKSSGAALHGIKGARSA